ncbi:MAG: hypothetical protein KIT80_17445 [Chitinophagaceae bacterium]|nr:hypothetical protein [Chitinophagaceae bacterium]MCW5928708.1 hypothetical protein [Chitinophagaceae bacterium]
MDAQSVKRKALLVNNAGDTLTGWVDYKNWRKNPAGVVFYTDSLSRSATTYSVGDIQFLNVLGYDQYLRAIVTKDNRPVVLSNLLEQQEVVTSTDTVLLRRLVYGGGVELFLFNDFKSHFYIHTDRGYEELGYKVSSRDAGMFTEKGYVKQLKLLLEGAQPLPLQLLNQIDKAEYKETDLVKIVKNINEAMGSGYTEEKSGANLAVKFFVGAGGGYSWLDFAGVYPAFDNMKFSGSFVPFATAGLDISATRNLQDLVLRIELAYTSAHYKGAGHRRTFIGSSEQMQTTYEVQHTNIAPSLAILYNFLRNDRRKVYVGFGAGYHLSFYGKNRYFRSSNLLGEETLDNYLDFPKGWMTMQAKAGYKLANKWEIGLNGQISGTFTNYVAFSLKPNTYTAQLRYFF